MNTFERHNAYYLRKKRARKLRRAIAGAALSVFFFFVAWSLVSSFAPGELTPPPQRVGGEAAERFVSTATKAMNSIEREIRPGRRADLKRQTLSTLAGAVGVSSKSFSKQAATQPAVAHGRPSSTDNGPGRSRSLRMQVPALPLLSDLDVESPPESELLVTEVDRIVDILLLGLDSRLGKTRARADAIHLVSINIDNPAVTITSIPRGTPSQMGYQNSASNIISNVRSARGRDEMLRRVAGMCGRDSIPYYVEIGFSDALGILEILGYPDPVVELQLLRMRRAYQFGDHNRCYNQGLFIKRTLLNLLPLCEGASGELLLRAGLTFAETNLDLETCQGLAYLLNDARIVPNPDRVTVNIRSRFKSRITAASTSGGLSHAIGGLDYGRFRSGDNRKAEVKIRRALSRAAGKSTPAGVKKELWQIFRQHGWLQIGELQTRRLLRDSLAGMLTDACKKLDRPDLAAQVKKSIEADDVLFFQAPGK